jgi:hypothetical protein
VGGSGGGPCRSRKSGGGGRYGEEVGLVGAVVAGAVVAAAVLAVMAAAVGLMAAAMVSMAEAEDRGQPLMGLLVGWGRDRHTQFVGNIWLLFGILFRL